MSRPGCKLCNWTGYRRWRDRGGREVAARCQCNPAPPAKQPAKKRAAGQPKPAPPAADPPADERREWFP